MKERTPMAAAGWKPRAERTKNRSGRADSQSAQSRNTKRSRLGGPDARQIYTNAKAYKLKGYGELCRKADKLNGQRR